MQQVPESYVFNFLLFFISWLFSVGIKHWIKNRILFGRQHMPSYDNFWYPDSSKLSKPQKQNTHTHTHSSTRTIIGFSSLSHYDELNDKSLNPIPLRKTRNKITFSPQKPYTCTQKLNKIKSIKLCSVHLFTSTIPSDPIHSLYWINHLHVTPYNWL